MSDKHQERSYLRSAIVTSENPAKPLEGTVVAVSKSHNISIEDSLLDELVREAHERYDVESYAAELRLGTVYFDAASQAIEGVVWEDSPLVYDHGDVNEDVEMLPDNLIPIDEDRH